VSTLAPKIKRGARLGRGHHFCNSRMLPGPASYRPLEILNRFKVSLLDVSNFRFPVFFGRVAVSIRYSTERSGNLGPLRIPRKAVQ